MQTSQIQLKISLSEQLNKLLQARADELGVPVTQYVKHIIIKDVEEKVYPVYTVSQKTDEKAQKALKELGKSEEVEDVADYFKKL